MSVHTTPTGRNLTIRDIQAFRDRDERFTMVTAYDALTAQILAESGVPMLLVGDSLGMVVLGYDSTVPVTMDDMVHHCAAVRRGAPNSIIVADMPFGSFQGSVDNALSNAARLMKQGGATAVKVEGGGRIACAVERLVTSGIPVMAHVGLTPQHVNQVGGFRVQGRDADTAAQILADAVALAEAGAFTVLLECVPAELGRRVTARLSVPTIGIGAGGDTTGQVLVIDDLIGRTTGRLPRFVKQYANVRAIMSDAVKTFQAEVQSGDYPEKEHTY